MQENNGFTVIEHSLSAIPDSVRKHILNHIRKITEYEPVIGIIGKTGAGKSSLCNALFKGEVSAVSDVSACTREPLRLRISVGRYSLTLVDLPGVGESLARDQEYRALYHEWLPWLDLVLWVMKADDRALSIDEQFYRQVIGEAHRHKVLFVVNQADKIEPCHEWDLLTGSPSAMQYLNIQSRLIDIGKLFSPAAPVVAISARTGWGLTAMAEAMMKHLPAQAGSPVSTQLREEVRTEQVKSRARYGFGEAVGRSLDAVAEGPFIPAPVSTLIRCVRDAVVSVARAVWDFFF
ncbi:hypothetical protein BHT19_0012885 [[Kluyvera] intestini]|nr:hypothetical protein BHT19_0012885 [[Kluyvera] intestini]